MEDNIMGDNIMEDQVLEDNIIEDQILEDHVIEDHMMGDHIAKDHITKARIMNDDVRQYYELDVFKLARVLWTKLWILILSGIVGGGIVFTTSYLMISPLYESEALLYVNNSSFSVGSTSFSISPSELLAAQSLVETYQVILQTRTTLNDIIAKANVNYSYEELSEMLSSQSISKTEVFSVKVTSTDPEEAEKIANTIAEILPKRISSIVEGSSVKIVDYAIAPTEKSSPNLTKMAAIGSILSVMFVCAILIFRSLLDTKIHDDESLTRRYNIPVLALIPHLND